jgi:hypothetical protein
LASVDLLAEEENHGFKTLPDPRIA